MKIIRAIYVDERVWREFLNVCRFIERIPASQKIEELMKKFVEEKGVVVSIPQQEEWLRRVGWEKPPSITIE